MISSLIADAPDAARNELIRRIELVRDEFGDIRGMTVAQGAIKGKVIAEFILARFGNAAHMNNDKTDRTHELYVQGNLYNITSGLSLSGVKMNWDGDAETAAESTKQAPTAGLIFLHHPRRGMGTITVTSLETLKKIKAELGADFFNLPKGGDARRGVAYSTAAMHKIIALADECMAFKVGEPNDIFPFDPYARGIREFKKFL